MDTTDQEKTTDEILEFLGRYGKSLKILVSALEEGNETQCKFSLAVLADADLGHHIAAAMGLTESRCLERLAGPLKAIEADLNRTAALAGKVASPSLTIFPPHGLMVVTAVLDHVQKAGRGISAGKRATASTTPAPNLPSEDRKRWWKFWK
jgi:hypothetical protein